MRNGFALVVLLMLVAAPAFAADGNVPTATLESLGLGNMQTVSDAEGMAVRGRWPSFGAVKGTSLVFGQLLTPDTKNFVVGSSVNEVDGNAETTSSDGVLALVKIHGVALNLALNVTFPDTSVFSGSLIGSAGGAGTVIIK